LGKFINPSKTLEALEEINGSVKKLVLRFWETRAGNDRYIRQDEIAWGRTVGEDYDKFLDITINSVENELDILKDAQRLRQRARRIEAKGKRHVQKKQRKIQKLMKRADKSLAREAERS
jgi:hypothetical protein